MVAVPFLGSIVLFGGALNSTYCLQIFSKSGLLELDRSEDANIPGGMCMGSVVERHGVVYAVGWREVSGTGGILV